MIYLILFLVGTTLYLLCSNRLVIVHELCHALAIKHYKKDATPVIRYSKPILYEKRLIKLAEKKYGITFICDPVFLKEKKCNGYIDIANSTFAASFSLPIIRRIALAGVIEAYIRTALPLFINTMFLLNFLGWVFKNKPPIAFHILTFIMTAIWFICINLKSKSSDLSKVLHPELCEE